MTRALFVLSFAAVALALRTVRHGTQRYARTPRGPVTGRCADHRSKLRWSGYTSADVSSL